MTPYLAAQTWRGWGEHGSTVTAHLSRCSASPQGLYSLNTVVYSRFGPRLLTSAAEEGITLTVPFHRNSCQGLDTVTVVAAPIVSCGIAGRLSRTSICRSWPLLSLCGL